MKKQLKCYIYARVSTSMQVDGYIERGDGYDKIWFMMQMNESIIWLY